MWILNGSQAYLTHSLPITHQKEHSHNGCNNIQVCNKNASLSNAKSQHQASYWFPFDLLSKPLEGRQDLIITNGLQQTWSTLKENIS